MLDTHNQIYIEIARYSGPARPSRRTCCHRVWEWLPEGHLALMVACLPFSHRLRDLAVPAQQRCRDRHWFRSVINRVKRTKLHRVRSAATHRPAALRSGTGRGCAWWQAHGDMDFMPPATERLALARGQSRTASTWRSFPRGCTSMDVAHAAVSVRCAQSLPEIAAISWCRMSSRRRLTLSAAPWGRGLIHSC